MANQIRFKRASGSDPSASDLVLGEPAVRTDTAELFFKKDDGTVAKVSGGGGIDDGDKGDITVSNSGATFTIDNGVIDNANIASNAAIAVSKLTGVFPLSGGTITGDSTIASGITNKNIDIDINGTSTLIRFDDDLRATFGDSDDLQIFHDGSDSIIRDNGSGNLKIQVGTATKLEITSSGATITGALTGNLTGNASGSSGSCTGNAATATALETARTIAGVSFDGTANISLNNSNITNGAGYITATLTNEQVQDIVGNMVSGNTETGITVTYQDGDGTLDFVVATQSDNNFTTTLLNKLNGIASGATNVTNTNQLTNGAGFITSSGTSAACSGNAATATKLATARTIAGVSFDGSANISLNNNAITNGAGYVTSSVINSLNASNLSSGTIPDARFPATLPAISGANLTNLPATGGATGGGSDEVFYENDQTVTTNYTITNGKNAMAAGPITINSGVTVTVGSGETLTIV